MKNFLMPVGIFCVGLLLLSLWGFYWALHPIKILSPFTPKNFGLKYEDVEFVTSDNVKIRAWFIPNENAAAKTIILLHGYPADKGDILPSRYFLHKKYNLLFMDFRYLGESGGKYSTVGKDEVLDVLAAIHYLQLRGYHEMGIWGFSLGGAVALMAAKSEPDVKAIVAESSYARLDKMAYEYFRIPVLKYPLGLLLRGWGRLFLGYDIKSVSPMDSAFDLTIPILITHSKKDNVISFQHAELFQEKLKNKPNVEILIFDDLLHGQSAGDYKATIEGFFDRNL